MRVRFRFLALVLCLGLLPLVSGSAVSLAQSGAVMTSKAAAPHGEKVDINSATVETLKTIPGIGDAYAKRIVAGRPYANKTQLTTKGVLPQAVYDKVKDQMVASRAKK